MKKVHSIYYWRYVMRTFDSVVCSSIVVDQQRVGSEFTIFQYEDGTDVIKLCDEIEREGYLAEVTSSNQIQVKCTEEEHKLALFSDNNFDEY